MQTFKEYLAEEKKKPKPKSKKSPKKHKTEFAGMSWERK